MLPRFLLLPFAFCLLHFDLKAQTGCPGCLVALPPLPEDTIYLSAAPDGVAGQPYDGDVSFRMPKTTTPVHAVDPSTPAGLTIDKITIISVVNVPPGLSWETDQNEYDPADQTDGCVKFCGTPLQPGLYEVQVFVTAEVSLVTQSTSFSLSIFIAPAVSANDGFSMQNSSGCGSVTVSFQNNVPSSGSAGYSYAWDFGNGSSSSLEDPPAQTYGQPGAYPVSFQATVDTFGYLLANVQVLAAGCDDTAIPPFFSGAPDLYLKIKDSTGTIIFETSPATNVSLPFAFNVNLPLGTGGYELEIRDDDTFGSQGCGYIDFDRNSTGTLSSGDLQVSLNIFHPVSEIQTTDTVFVFEQPAPPLVTPSGAVEICAGEEVELTSSQLENVQWFRDTSVLFGEDFPEITLSEAGSYWVEHTSPDGCKSQSEPVQVSVLPLPAAPAFHNENNLLVLNDSSLLPASYSLQWLVNGAPAPGETEPAFCMTAPGTALYTLQVTDNATGCASEFSLGATLDPNFDCTVAAEELAAVGHSLRVSPNPAVDELGVFFKTERPVIFDLAVLDAVGRVVFQKNSLEAAGGFSFELDVSGFPAGLYFVRLVLPDGAVGRKVVKLSN